jgi:hypothetical protein
MKLVLASFLWVLVVLVSCSAINGDEYDQETQYGFNLTDVLELYSVDSIVVVVDGLTTDTLYFDTNDVDDKSIVRFTLIEPPNSQITVSYTVWSGDLVVAANTQTFVSGDAPTVPRPNLAPVVMVTDTVRLERTVSWEPKAKGTDPERSALQYAWDFAGSGVWVDSSSENDDTKWMYDSVGHYLAVVRVRDDFGLVGYDTAVVQVVPMAPELALEAPDTVSIFDTIQVAIEVAFDGDSSASGAQMVWSAGETQDTLELSTLQKAVFTEPGKYALRVGVLDSYGTAVLDSVQVVVVQDAPVVNAGSDASGTVGSPIAFVGTATQKFGTIVNQGWSFDGDTTGDAWDTVFTELNAAILHTYKQAGNYTALYFAEDDDGNRTIGTRRMSISRATEGGVHIPQILNWSANDTVVSIKDSVVFTVPNNGFTDAAGPSDVKQFLWDLDGDGLFEVDSATNGVVGFRYNIAGTYWVRLRLVDSNGDEAQDSLQIRVLQGLPTVHAGTAVLDGSAGTAVAFTGTASDLNTEGSYDATDGEIVLYKWDYDGDGEFDRESDNNSGFTYTYPDVSADTTYIAKFCAVDDDDNEVCDSRSVRIVNRPPELASGAITVSSNPISIQMPAVIGLSAPAFTDIDGNQIDSVTWSFDDGSAPRAVATADTIHFVRQEAGTVVVTATVKDKWGASASQSVSIAVEEGTIVIQGAGDIRSVTGEIITLNPEVELELGQQLAKCEWSIGGVNWVDNGATCEKSVTMPSIPHQEYLAIFKVTTNVGTQAQDTINILVRDGFVDKTGWQGVCYGDHWGTGLDGREFEL